jgi:hypothetical protein
MDFFVSVTTYEKPPLTGSSIGLATINKKGSSDMDSVEAETQKTGSVSNAVERKPISCPARLSMASGYRSGHIVDMTLSGATLELSNPPKLGSTVLLLWLEHEAFARVAWVQTESCGLNFERPLKQPQVFELTGGRVPVVAPHRPTERVANTCNIPLGQKRGGRPQLIAA